MDTSLISTDDNRSELLQISKYDLWRINRTMNESLQDSGYIMESPLKDLTFPQFVVMIKDLKKKRDTVLLKILKTKKSNNKKLKQLDSILENGDDSDFDGENKQDKKNKNEEDDEMYDDSDDDGDDGNTDKRKKELLRKNQELDKKFYDTTMSTFEMCLTFYGHHKDDENRKIVVLYSCIPLLNKESMRQLALFLEQKKHSFMKAGNSNSNNNIAIKDVQLIVSHGLTSAGYTTLLVLQQKYDILLRFRNSVVVNFTQHIDVRKHEKLQLAERKKFLQKYKYNDNNESVATLPKLKSNYPIATYYNFKPGDIVKIYDDKSAYSYRIVETPVT